MKLGIDASRAFLKNRTGIEEYSFRVIEELVENLKSHEVVLYLRKNQEKYIRENKDLYIHKYLGDGQVVLREIKFYRFWTQVGLALELLINPVDVLFVPAHTIPWVHPKKTVVTIHGLEYEHCPESYSLYSRLVHRFFIKKSCRWAKTVIAVSKKTKNDLVEMYRVVEDKIRVVYNGFSAFSFSKGGLRGFYENDDNKNPPSLSLRKGVGKYILYVGRLEKRKNIEGIIKTFETLKERYGYAGKLVLAGKPGYGYKNIKYQISNIKSSLRDSVIEKGFIEDEEKWDLLKGADVFMFPSISEGFGIPILEAQSVGTSVITSNYGPMDEVAGDENVLVNPKDVEQMASLANKLINDKKFRKEAVAKGLDNVGRFSWEKSADKVREILLQN